MPLHDSPQFQELRDPEAERHNARLGLILFGIYLAAYGGFVVSCVLGFSAIDPIIFGMSLIFGAMVISLVYMVMCRKPKAGTP
jgi:formate-dependent nitrite reductase membrane component NrfD